MESLRSPRELILFAWLYPLVWISLLLLKLVVSGIQCSLAAQRVPELADAETHALQPRYDLVGFHIDIGAVGVQLGGFDVRLPIDARKRSVVRESEQ